MAKPFTKEYALYKGEEILCMGTAKEIQEQMGWKNIKTVYWLHSPVNIKRNKCGNRLVLVSLDD